MRSAAPESGIREFSPAVPARAGPGFEKELRQRLGVRPEGKLPAVTYGSVAEAGLQNPLLTSYRPSLFEMFPGGRIYAENAELRRAVDSSLKQWRIDAERLKALNMEVLLFRAKTDRLFEQSSGPHGNTMRKVPFPEFLQWYLESLKGFSARVGEMDSARAFLKEACDSVSPKLKRFGWL